MILYLKSNTFLSADIFEKVFKNLSIAPCIHSYSPKISFGSCFKKDQSKIRIINWYDILFVVE